MFFVEAYTSLPEPAKTLIFIFQIIWGIGCFILGILAMYYMKKTEMKSRKNYYLGLSMIFLLVGISRIIFTYHDFIAPEELDIPLWKVASTINLIGLLFMSYMIETYVYKKSKHLVSIIGVCLIVLFIVITDVTLSKVFLYIGNALMLILPFLLYLFVMINTSGVIRKRAAIIVVGMIILMIGTLFSVFVLMNLLDNTTSLILGPPFTLTGFIIIWYGFITMPHD